MWICFKKEQNKAAIVCSIAIYRSSSNIAHIDSEDLVVLFFIHFHRLLLREQSINRCLWNIIIGKFKRDLSKITCVAGFSFKLADPTIGGNKSLQRQKERKKGRQKKNRRERKAIWFGNKKKRRRRIRLYLLLCVCAKIKEDCMNPGRHLNIIHIKRIKENI